MPTPPVQALLTEYATPTFASAASVSSTATSLQALITTIRKQIIEYENDVNAIVNPAPLLVGQLERLYQVLGAMQREADSLTNALRQELTWQTQFAAYMGEFQTAVNQSDAATPAATVTLTGIPATLAVGATAQGVATSKDANGNPLVGRTYTWQTSKAQDATVDANGLVTGVSAGTGVVITVTDGTVSATATLDIQ